jgi:D-lyxose ketol-isomerase
MMTEEKIIEIKNRSKELLSKAGVVITAEEFDSMEVVDFGFGKPEILGLQIIVYVNNSRYCAKELILLPGQTCAQHKHGPLGPDNPGKMETFRCRWGEVYLMVPGEPTEQLKVKIPEFRKQYFTIFHQIILTPGKQYTIEPDTFHWFQAGPDGAVVSEFSSPSFDEKDIFLDPDIIRVPK